MRKTKRIISACMIFLFFGLTPVSASAYTLIGDKTRATLGLELSGRPEALNDNLSISIYVNTGGQNVVAVAAYLYYDKTNFQALNIDFSDSVFTNTFENTIDASNGKIKIAQAKPTPGVNISKGLVAKVNFKVIGHASPANDNFIFDFTPGSTLDSNIVLDDGKGTDIISGVYNEKIIPGQPIDRTNEGAPQTVVLSSSAAENSARANKADISAQKLTYSWTDLMDEAYAVYHYNKFTPLTQDNILLYRRVTAGYDNLNDQAKFAIARYIQNGTGSSLRLGAGERAGTINSFKTAFNKLPLTLADWQDVIKIANGRWLAQTNAKAESRAKTSFAKIYLRQPDQNNKKDANAIMVAAYGLRPLNRNMKSEKFAIATFKDIYGHGPANPADWDLVRTIAYSGTKR